ncbi:single-stranded DNA-binding protein [Nitrobacter sp.]|uniref:single-stranded DNA-binding protein n=1 Tax=Nitrobacter sp. TaxID=29420 RepID=UPI0029CAB90B|nr:single-stranded DNA-binding protein [Nitrobacter sp.]
MTAHVLITGNLFRTPERKTSATGNAYVRATLKVAGADNGPAEFWSALIFSQSAQDEIVRLSAGDRISMQGSLKLSTYIAGNGETRIDRTIFADGVLALKPAPRIKKPKAVAEPAKTNILPPSGQTRDMLDDDIPF